mmetsp:Transcript_7699/g.17996  ORF Transcript_7699/g.17996 Transcript_7699/m.17996 type:complete len:240 (-) Transcript_7699:1015-1734(-)
MSRPRDATSVATRTPVGLRLKRDMAELRSPWLLSPWIDITDADDDAMDGDCDRRPESDSQSSLVATKTMHRPIGARTGSISRSHWALALASGRTMTWLSTCSDEVPVLPTAILFFLRGEGESGKGKSATNTTGEKRRKDAPMLPLRKDGQAAQRFSAHLTGSLSQLRATFSTRLPKVALRRRVCLSGRIFSRMLVTCFSKPIESIRSASSSTRNVTLFKLVPFFFTMSMRRPGVEITIS